MAFKKQASRSIWAQARRVRPATTADSSFTCFICIRSTSHTLTPHSSLMTLGLCYSNGIRGQRTKRLCDFVKQKTVLPKIIQVAYDLRGRPQLQPQNPQAVATARCRSPHLSQVPMARSNHPEFCFAFGPFVLKPKKLARKKGS